ncbi:MAG: hypothetical protein IH989_00655, partial [Planctomycetes bacterium]|nr:hypothetical protein [Planctomycetota bacterium]
MRRTTYIAVLAVFVSCGTAHGGPVLLGSISNSWQGTDPTTMETIEMGDRLLYVVVGDSRYGDLFEETRVLVRRDDPPIIVDESMILGSDSDFALIAELLTDGTSLGEPDGSGLQEIRVLGLIGGEEIIDVHVPRISEFDLFGYEVERIDRRVAFTIMSPGGIPGTEGTVFRIEGVYEFWGIPEPTTLGLLCAGSILLLR